MNERKQEKKEEKWMKEREEVYAITLKQNMVNRNEKN
jgi:hypothetical protein